MVMSGTENIDLAFAHFGGTSKGGGMSRRGRRTRE